MLSAVLVVPYFVMAGQDAAPNGTICVARVSEPTSGEKSLANATGSNPEPDYSVQVDRGELVGVPRSAKGDKRGVLMEGLDVGSRHLIVIRHKGRVVESFYFRYPNDEPKQCLFLNELYLTWQMWPMEKAPWCKCQDAG